MPAPLVLLQGSLSEHPTERRFPSQASVREKRQDVAAAYRAIVPVRVCRTETKRIVTSKKQSCTDTAQSPVWLAHAGADGQNVIPAIGRAVWTFSWA